MRDFGLTEEERICRMSVSPKKIRLVIDSDAKNEVDDQFAIAWALRSSERFVVEAVYAAPFSHSTFYHNLGMEDYPKVEPPGIGMEKSYQEIQQLLRLLGNESECRAFRGAKEYLRGPGQAVDSDAVEDLICRGMTGDEVLYVAALGAATNIASALIREPHLREKIVVVWLGGQPPVFSHGVEFNLAQDIFAAQYLFACGVPMVWVPCMTVASQLILTDSDIKEKLLGKSAIGTYLAQIVQQCFPSLEAAVSRAAYHRKVVLRGRDDMDEAYLAQFSTHSVAWSRSIWDISTIAFLKNPNWVQSILIPAPCLGDDCRWLGVSEDGHRIRMATYCQRDLIFGDLIACLNHD